MRNFSPRQGRAIREFNPRDYPMKVRPGGISTGSGMNLCWADATVTGSSGSLTPVNTYGSPVILQGSIPDFGTLSPTFSARIFMSVISCSGSTSGSIHSTSWDGACNIGVVWYVAGGNKIKHDGVNDQRNIGTITLYDSWGNYSSYGPPWQTFSSGQSRAVFNYYIQGGVPVQSWGGPPYRPIAVGLFASARRGSFPVSLRISCLWTP